MPNYYEKNFRDILPYRRHHPGLFGVELELEGGLWPQAPDWTVKPENSLRNGGAEYILQTPANLPELEGRLVNLNAGFKQLGTFLTPSFRTSTHFHYNVQQMSMHGVVRAAVVWTLLEDYILSLLPQDRRGNLFCLSSRDTGDMAEHIFNQICQAKRYYGGGFHDRGKYAAFCDRHINDFGSVEFRVFPEALKGNQIDVGKILGWAKLISLAMTHSVNMKVEKVLRMVDEARSMPEIFLGYFFPKIEGDPQLVSESAPEAHEIALAILKGENSTDETLKPIPDFDDDDPPEEIRQDYQEEDEDEGPF